MTTIGAIIIIITAAFFLKHVENKLDEMEWEIFQMKEKLKDKGLLD